VGRLVDWRGRFFARRYSAEPIVDEPAQVERLVYILSHGVKEGLVSSVAQWPGLSCARALLEGHEVTHHTWRDWTRRWAIEVKQGVSVGRFSEECPSEPVTLALTPLPCWSALPAPERSRLVAELVAQIDGTARSESAVPGPVALAAQDPHRRPRHSKHTPRPKAHASTTQVWVEAVEAYRAFLAAFRQAAREWMSGRFGVAFPLHCFRPPAWGVPG
jgi:hypothetical protein